VREDSGQPQGSKNNDPPALTGEEGHLPSADGMVMLRRILHLFWRVCVKKKGND
jgi:hypothetical protein